MKSSLKFKMILVSLIAVFAVSLFGGLIASGVTVKAESVSVFRMVNGAEVRVGDRSGLRFIVQMSDDYYTELTTEDDSKLYVAIVPYSYYERYSKANFAGALCEYLTQNGKQFVSSEIPVDKIYPTEEDGQTYYYANAVMSNVLFNNYNGSFVGVGYIARTNGGETAYEEVAALDKDVNARSVFQIALKALEDDYSAETVKELNTIVEKALYNAAGVTYDQASGKYVYDGNEYDEYSSVGITPSLDGMSLETTESVKLLKGKTQTAAKTFTFDGGIAFGGDAMFVWSSSDETVATVDGNGVITAVGDGYCTVTLSALNGRYTSDCAVEVYSYEGINYASADKATEWTYTEIENAYDSDNGVIELTKKYGGVHYTHSHIEIQIMDEVRAAKAAGMKMLSFEYFADGIDNGATDNTIRIVANNDASAIGQGNSIVTDFLLTKEMEGRWNKVIIDLTPSNPAYVANIDNTTYKNFEIVIGGAAGATFAIRNVVFGNATDYNTEFVTNYFDNVNYSEYQYLGEYKAAEGASAYIDYINQWGVTRIVKQGTGFSGSYDHVVLEIMDEVRAAKAAGKKLLTFEYMTFGGLYGQGEHSPKVYIGSSNGTAGVAGIGYWLTQQEHLSATEGVYKKVYIDLSNDLVDYAAFKYMSFVVGGEYDGYFCIRNLKFEGAAEYNAIKYDLVDYSDWNRWLGGRGASTWTDDCAMSYDYDDVNDAVIFTKGANTDALHYGSTYLEIMDEVRAAIAAGKTKLSFEYYTANAGSSQGTRLWIAGVSTASKDMVTGSGIWITIGETLTLNAWTKVEIDLTSSNPCLTNITNESNEYLGIIFDGEQGATLKIREFKFS